MVRRLSILMVFAVVVAACSSQSATSTSTGPGSTVPGATTSTGSGSPSTSTADSTTTTAADLSELDAPQVVRDQLEELIMEAQQVRELPFLDSPVITIVTTAELEARVRQIIQEDADDYPADEALYQLLGLLAPESDLESTLLDLYGEQVAGFYDGETGEIVVPAREDGFTILQQATMVHELVHALTDQHFSFDPVFQTMAEEDRLDEVTAYQALIEGDATLAQLKWIQGLSQSELGQFVAESLDVDTSSLNSVPSFLRDTLFFPYDSGLVFVQDLYGVGGWLEVNNAYDIMPDLPGSSEQIITPGDYQRDLPMTVSVPAVDLAGYELERTSVWGEQGFRIMLDQVAVESTTAAAADGWGGDGYNQWFDGSNAAFLLVYEGDTAADLAELEDALLKFAIDSVPEEAFVWVDTADDQLFFIAATVPEVGQEIRSSVGLG
jgi:hypothetical protein